MQDKVSRLQNKDERAERFGAIRGSIEAEWKELGRIRSKVLEKEGCRQKEVLGTSQFEIKRAGLFPEPPKMAKKKSKKNCSINN